MNITKQQNHPVAGSMATVLLKPGEADRIVGGHPWIYEGAILRVTAEAANGDVVQVKDHRQRFIGVGFFNGLSKIRVRMIAYDRATINTAFFETRIRRALEVRKRHLGKAKSFRLVNAESDFLSGLIVDNYDGVLVIQTSSLGMDQRKKMIVDALVKVMAPQAVFERNDISSRKFEGLTETSGILYGKVPENMTLTMNDLSFSVDILAGHKTGFYLDQQENYRAVAEWAKGARVLDCFCFLGGFSLHAARAGALSVHGLDQSEEAIAKASANAKRNKGCEACTFEAANVFDWLRSMTTPPTAETAQTSPYDLIILDPPSFTRNRASVPDALRGYKDIHLRSMKLLKPGGLLATFCCSHHVSSQAFLEVINEAAYDARKILRLVKVFSQSPDHPVIPSIPETTYLKGFGFEIADF